MNIFYLADVIPKTKLYSPKYGDVWFCGIYKLSRTEGIIYVYTTKLQDGCTRPNFEQCKEERDWSKWKAINTRFNPQSVKKVLNPI